MLRSISVGSKVSFFVSRRNICCLFGSLSNTKSRFDHTSFFASKKLFRCRICQAPIRRRMQVWPKDHHSTREFVLSLVCRNRSSRYWNQPKGYFLLLLLFGRTIAYPLIILFLGDLFNLVQELTDSELKLGQLLLLSDVGVVDCVLADLDVQMYSLKSTRQLQTINFV